MNNLIHPCLWFDGKAKEAAAFYCSVFGKSQITSDSSVVVIFESHKQKFMCLNGGAGFGINPSISFYVVFKTAEELDSTWNALIEGGSELMPPGRYDWSERYGWLSDRYGVNWQLTMGNPEEMGRKFTPALMFTGSNNGRAEEAISYYSSIFSGSSVRLMSRYPEGASKVANAIQHSQFHLGSNLFIAMDSDLDHGFTFNEAVSLVVECNSQEEIDYYWERLTEEGEEIQCGWLKDKFGVSWQVVPAILQEIMDNPSRAERVLSAILEMKKLDIAAIVNA